MRTQSNVLSLDKSLTHGVKHKELDYKGFKLASIVVHCGMAGSYWLITILDYQGNTLASFEHESFNEALKESMTFIDERVIA